MSLPKAKLGPSATDMQRKNRAYKKHIEDLAEERRQSAMATSSRNPTATSGRRKPILVDDDADNPTLYWLRRGLNR